MYNKYKYNLNKLVFNFIKPTELEDLPELIMEIYNEDKKLVSMQVNDCHACILHSFIDWLESGDENG